jgi:etoposide-induced 2.4 mRNA
MAVSSERPSSSSTSSEDVSSSEVEVVELEWSWKQEAFLLAMLYGLGFLDACCLNRAYSACRRSERVLKKTGRCFLLNGVVFLGSILILQKVVSPTVRWLLNAQLHNAESTSLFSGLLANFIIGCCYWLWLYPLLIGSFVANCLWYKEIAAHGFIALNGQASGSSTEPGPPGKGKSPRASRKKSDSAIESLLLGIGEQIYSIILLTVFYAEVSALSLIPVIGQPLQFVGMSWLYGYYCFEYKWGLSGWSLENRLLFFESNWAFFAGFGSPCVLATFFLPSLVGGGVMAVVFPIFVLVATASDPEAAVKYCLGGKDLGFPHLPLFYLPNKITVPLVRFIQAWWASSTVKKKAQ